MSEKKKAWDAREESLAGSSEKTVSKQAGPVPYAGSQARLGLAGRCVVQLIMYCLILGIAQRQRSRLGCDTHHGTWMMAVGWVGESQRQRFGQFRERDGKVSPEVALGAGHR